MLLGDLQVDLGVAVGGVEPARLLPLVALQHEVEGQPGGTGLVLLLVLVLALETEARDGGRDLHLALVTRLIPDHRVAVGVACTVALQGAHTRAEEQESQIVSQQNLVSGSESVVVSQRNRVSGSESVEESQRKRVSGSESVEVSQCHQSVS